MSHRWQSSKRQPGASKVPHEEWYSALFPATRFTRLYTGTLSLHHFAFPWRFADWVSVLLSTDSVCSSRCGLFSKCWSCWSLVLYDDYLQRFPWSPVCSVDFRRHSSENSQVLPRFLTKQDIPHLFFQLGSQDCIFLLFNCIFSPYLGASRYEFQFCCLWTPFVSQGVVCFHSVGLVGSWTFTVIIFNDPRGSTLFVSLYVLFA